METTQKNISKITLSFEITNLRTRLWSLVGIIILSFFAYFQAIYYIIPEFQIFQGKSENIDLHFLMNFMWVPIISYILVSVWFILFTLIVKGKIKKHDEKSLIGGLIVGLIVGLIGGLIGEFEI